MRLRHLLLALVALAAMAGSLWQLAGTTAGLRIETHQIEGTPVTVFRPDGAGRGPVVVIAHGFAGSQQFMRPYAITLARNGLTAVTFDFLGHGRNPNPLTGSITELDGATRSLVGETRRVIAFARGIGDGRLAILGHSMASDIVVRTAEAEPEIAATVAVSMFSPAVTATAPRNLLVIVGDWEPGLKQEALRAIGLATAPLPAEPGTTYGRLAEGSGRRLAIAPDVEHISVLYSATAMREATAWLGAVFGQPPATPPYADARGPWILLLIGGIVVLLNPLCRLLPVVAAAPMGAGQPWRRYWLPLLGATLATPLLLRWVPTDFLPVLVADYLAVHFGLFGLLLALGTRLSHPAGPRIARSRPRLLLAALLLTLASTGGLALALDSQVTAFLPPPARWPLILAMLVGTLAFFLALEWATHGPGAARGGYAAGKLAFLLSLALAVALDFERLFFLAIIVPVVVVFFLITGLFSAWAYRRTRHPGVAAVANAVLFAWAIGVTFPLLAR